MKNLMDIILNSEQVHEFRIKFAFQPSDQNIERIKQILGKYDLVDCSPLTRTIFQVKPMDFYNLDAGEIWMFDVTLAQPVIPEILQAEVSGIVGCAQDLVHVRDKASPYQQQMAAQEDDIEFDEVVSLAANPDHEKTSICPHSISGDNFADEVVQAAKDHFAAQVDGKYNDFDLSSLVTDKTDAAKYMVAGFNAFNPKASTDVPKDAGPRKE